MSNMTKSVSEVIHDEYRDYSLYVLGNRAIPSLIDGLKPSQRKALYTAISYAKSNVKTVSLIGRTIADGQYHHGDGSLGSAINLMAADWCNNAPLFVGEGSFGSRMVPAAAAPRYTSLKLSPNFNKFFKDNDILPQNDDPENPEPKFYLPIIPWVLVNGIKGIAIGFATEIQPRNPNDLKNICIDYIKTGNLPARIKPYYSGFRGKILLDRKRNTWYCEGVFDLKSKTQLEITELPIGMTRAKFVEHLDKLEDANKIANYYDRCDKSGFNFDIRLKRGGKMLTDAKIVQMFKLRAYLNENLTVLDENGEVLVFDNEIDVLKRFCDLRIKYVANRLKFYIERDTEELRFLKVKRQFIDNVNTGKIKLIKQTNNQLLDQIKKTVDNLLTDDIPRLLSIRTSQYCDEAVKVLDDRIKELVLEIKKNSNLPAVEAYLDDLQEL